MSRQGNNQVLNVLFIGVYTYSEYRDAVKQCAEYQSIIVSVMSRYAKYCRQRVVSGV